MSIEALIAHLGSLRPWLVGYLLALPLLAFVIGLGYRRIPRRGARDYLYSLLVYLAAVPGMFAAVLVFYSLFLLHANLLKVDMVVYFLPLLSMGLVFWLVGRKTSMDRLPGFDHLWGLMLLIGLACLCVLLLYRLRFVIGFFGSLEGLLVAGVVIYLLFKLALDKLAGRSKGSA